MIAALLFMLTIGLIFDAFDSDPVRYFNDDGSLYTGEED